MKLYDASRAPSPRVVRVFLAEKGIDVPLEQVDIVNAENRKPPFLKINPMGTVPVLELDDGSHISETIGICRYFEALQPEPPLMGRDPRDQGLVEMWRRRMELEVVMPIAQVFRNTSDFFKDRIPQSPEWAEICQRHATKRLEWLDGVLAEQPYIAGDNYTIADVQAMVGIDFGRVVGIRPEPDTHPHIKRWHDSVSSRPSAKA